MAHMTGSVIKIQLGGLYLDWNRQTRRWYCSHNLETWASLPYNIVNAQTAIKWVCSNYGTKVENT